MTGAIPPFLPLARHVEGEGVPPGVKPGVTPTYGVAPVCMYPCGKAPPPASGRKAHSSPIVNRQAEDGAAMDTPGTWRHPGFSR